MRKIPFFRIIFSIIAIGLIGFGCCCIFDAINIKKELDSLKDEVVVLGKINLSEKGIYEYGLNQKSSVGHGTSLYIDTNPFEMEEDAKDYLAGLKFNYILMQNGEKCRSGEFKNEPVVNYFGFANIIDGRLPIIYFFVLREGEYDLEINVEQAASNAIDTADLKMRYEFCGCEYMIVMVANVVGGLSSLIGAVILLGVFLYTKKKRQKVKEVCEV